MSTLLPNTSLLPFTIVFSWAHTHTHTPHTQFQEAPKRLQQSNECDPLFEQVSEVVDLPGAAAEPFFQSQLLGGRGSLGGFWGLGGAAEVLGCVCHA